MNVVGQGKRYWLVLAYTGGAAWVMGYWMLFTSGLVFSWVGTFLHEQGSFPEIELFEILVFLAGVPLLILTSLVFHFFHNGNLEGRERQLFVGAISGCGLVLGLTILAPEGAIFYLSPLVPAAFLIIFHLDSRN